MKNLIVILILAVLLITSVIAAPRNDNYTQGSKQSNIAYTIDIAEKVVDGKYYPPQQFEMERLPAENLHANIFEIKTKSHQFINGTTGRFDNKQLQSDLDKINMLSARAPYAEYFQGNQLLSADKFGVSRIYEIRYEGNHDPYEICQMLMQNPEIEYATPVFKRFHYAFTPNDPRYPTQYHLAKIMMSDAWEITQGDTNVVIAIIDSGTDIEHEDLKANIWTNRGEIPNNGRDDDGNGKVDDVNGWDFIGNITAQQYQQGQFKQNNNPLAKLNTHGTHTAGCASAVTNNTTGVAAPGFKCRILPVKCASDSFQSPGILRGYEGILYAAVTGADIINCSWGGPGSSPAEQDIINQATNLGALVVVASGNSGKNLDVNPDYPAALKGVLSVGSSGSSDRASNFASYGSLVRVFAPGEQILSTLPNNRYEAQTGTSMSSPVVAGVAALIKSIHKDWTPEQIIHQLRGTCDNVLQPASPQLRPYFFGRVNALKALQRNNLPGQDMPGIELQFVKAGSSNVITNHESTEVTISLRNVLASDKNVKVRIIPIDDFISFDETEFDIGDFASKGIKVLTTNAKLLSHNPWFRGDADVLIEITGTDYINLETAKISINIPSSNVFTNYASYPSEYGITWHSSSIYNNDLIFVVGALGDNGAAYVYKSNGSSRNLMQISNLPVYCIYAFDNNKLIAGDGPASGQAQIHYSSNSGQSWTRKPISGITPFVNSFNFFNNFQGLMLGDPKSGSWGVGYTNDAGETWQLVSGLPAPLLNETGLVGSVAQAGEKVWFGTTAGRVFRTDDKGETWSASLIQTGGYITSLSFSDSIGVCIYAESSTATATRYLAISKDGGTTWTSRVYNFTLNNQFPLEAHAVQGTNSIVVQLFDGKVIASDSEGKGWFPVLTHERDSYTLATTNQKDSKVSIFTAGPTEINRLDFNYTPAAIVKSILFVGGNSLDFASVNVDETKILPKDIRNVGNADVQINSITFVPDEGTDASDFAVQLPSPKTISPTQPSMLRLRFQPKTTGFKTGRFVINSDAEIADISLNVSGLATSASSIAEIKLSSMISISPNPATENIGLTFDESIQLEKIEIYDIKGTETLKFDNIHSGMNFDVSSLPVGTYYIRLYSAGSFITKSFVITR